MHPIARNALERLFRRALAYGRPAAQHELRRALDPDSLHALGPNDIDSAVVRWADAVDLVAVPPDIEDAAERVVASLAATAEGARS